MEARYEVEPFDRVAHLTADLSGLLEKTVSLARAGRWARVEKLSVQMDAVVASLVEARRPGDPMAGAEQARLKQLYSQLVAVVEAERENTRVNLRQLRGVKRAVGAYSGQMGKR